jgi:type IV pilus assembly protein PilZ
MSDKDKKDRRGHPRTPIKLEVEYQRINTFFQDYACNISKGGMFIRTRKPLPVGTRFELKLVIPDLAKPLEINGQVRWRDTQDDVALNPEKRYPGMGIRFVYETDGDRQQVEIIVEWLMKKHLGDRAYERLMGRE